jgi:hypothetical protein
MSYIIELECCNINNILNYEKKVSDKLNEIKTILKSVDVIFGNEEEFK